MSRMERLSVVLGLNLSLVVGLVLVGSTAHSLGVFAEGLDYLADAAAIGVTMVAIRLSSRRPETNGQRRYPKAASIAAIVNVGWLLILSLLVIAGALDRLIGGVHEVHGLPVLIASTVAAATMFGGCLILGGDIADDDDDGIAVSVRAVWLDTAADAAMAFGVAVTGAIILATHGNYWLDPAIALVIATVITISSVRLLRKAIGALKRT